MGTPPVTLRLLGPVEVDVDGEPMGLRARLPRNLLVALALQPGRVIGTDALLTALWDDDPPDSALGTLQSYVSTLRRALGDRTTVHSRAQGAHDAAVARYEARSKA